MREEKNNADALIFDEKELFNSQILQQYDNDGQKGFLGYLMRYEKWTVEGGEIKFPEITKEEQIKERLQAFNDDTKKSMLIAQKGIINEIYMFGGDEVRKRINKALQEIDDRERSRNMIEYVGNKGNTEIIDGKIINTFEETYKAEVNKEQIKNREGRCIRQLPTYNILGNEDKEKIDEILKNKENFVKKTLKTKNKKKNRYER